jgi:hypothetical protein
MRERKMRLRLIRDMGGKVRIPSWAPYNEGSSNPEERRRVFVDMSEQQGLCGRIVIGTGFALLLSL